MAGLIGTSRSYYATHKCVGGSQRDSIGKRWAVGCGCIPISILMRPTPVPFTHLCPRRNLGLLQLMVAVLPPIACRDINKLVARTA